MRRRLLAVSAARTANVGKALRTKEKAPAPLFAAQVDARAAPWPRQDCCLARPGAGRSEACLSNGGGAACSVQWRQLTAACAAMRR